MAERPLTNHNSLVDLMPSNRKYKIRFGNLTDVFRDDGNDSDIFEMRAHIARLCVLYEDWRLELKPILAEGAFASGHKDEFSQKAVRLYFLRRSIATLNEMSDAIVALDKCSAFKGFKARWPNDQRTAWCKAVDHFQEVKHHLKNVRNGVGGHFGHKVARKAIKWLASASKGVDASIGKMEICYDAGNPQCEQSSPTATLRLHFAVHIAGAALLEIKQGKSERSVHLQELLDSIIMPSNQYALGAMHLVSIHFLWPRFGKH